MIQHKSLRRGAHGCFLLIALLSVAFFAAVPVQGQVLYGSLVGTVTDPSGGVIPDPTVSATDSLTGATRDEKTDASGRYSFATLSPGTYSVKVTANGFRTVDQSNFVITPNVIGRIDFHLQVGQATETVTVSAETVQLQTDKADTHTELTSQ